MHVLRREFRFMVAILVFLVPLAPRGFGQATSGSILGRIADATDAVVVDAEVVARNENLEMIRKKGKNLSKAW